MVSSPVEIFKWSRSIPLMSLIYCKNSSQIHLSSPLKWIPCNMLMASLEQMQLIEVC